MSKRLKVALPEGWGDVTHLHEDATFSFRKDTGLLQVMLAEYQGGKPPLPSEADLKEFAVAAGNENHGGPMVSASSGPHRFGAMGTAVFREATGGQATSKPGSCPMAMTSFT